jgi:hypothetical protein
VVGNRLDRHLGLLFCVYGTSNLTSLTAKPSSYLWAYDPALTSIRVDTAGEVGVYEVCASYRGSTLSFRRELTKILLLCCNALFPPCKDISLYKDQQKSTYGIKGYQELSLQKIFL